MAQAERRIFAGEKVGMNLDVEERLVPPGQYRQALNVSLTINGSELAASNTLGNAPKTLTLPAGNNKCIGSFDYKIGQTVYYFLWNSAGNHQVLQYQYNSLIDAFTALGKGAGLGFTFNTKITSIVVVSNRFLVWTDNTNEVSYIDLSGAIVYPNPITAADRHYIELVKAPDPVPCQVFFVSDTEHGSSALSKKFYKFRTRYIYKGNFRTHCSTVTKLATPQYDYMTYTDGDSVQYDNAIGVHVPQPEFDDVVSVELLVSSGNDDNIMSDWYKFKEIPYESLEFGQTIVFTGAEALDAVDQTEVLQPYSFIPKKCYALEFLPSNTLCFADFTENMDADIEPKVQYEVRFTTKPTTTGAATTTATYTKEVGSAAVTVYNENFGIELTGTLDYDTITIGGTPKVGDNITIPLILTYTGSAPATITSPRTITIQFMVDQQDIVSTSAATNRAEIATRLAHYINTINTTQIGFGGVVAVYATGGVLRIYEGANQRNTPYSISTTADVTGVSPVALTVSSAYPNASNEYTEFRTITQFKQGAIHPLAIQYEDDKGRRTPAIPTVAIRVPFPENRQYASIRLFINHEAPVDAVRYHILYARNQTYDTYVQLFSPISLGTGSRFTVLTQTVINAYKADYENSSVTYTFLTGDRLRILGWYDNSLSAFNYITPVDLPVLTYDTSTGATVDFDISTYIGAPFDAASDPLMVELWRPKEVNSTRIYYEIGYTGEVFEDSGNFYHRGINGQDQSASQAAFVDLIDVGDSYYKYRPIGTAVTGTIAYVESENVSDFLVSKMTSIGRPNVEDTLSLQEITRGSSMYYTQPFIADTELNGLSIVLGSSLKEYSQQYGSIIRMRARDYTLLVWFEDRVGNVGITRELILQSDGTQTYKTDAILNSMNYYQYEGGICTQDESLATNSYRDYFTDVSRNLILRLSQDGITDISEYGIKKWVNDNIDPIYNQYTNLRSYGVYDEKNDSYVVSFQAIIDVDEFGNASSGVVETIDLINTDGGFTSATMDVDDSIILSSLTDSVEINPLSVTFINESTYRITWIGLIAAADVVGAQVTHLIGTLIFSEKKNSWTSFLGIVPESMCGIGTDWASFKLGQLYIHNQATRNTFYGSVATSEIDMVFNEPGVKLYENIMQESNTPWYSDTNGDVSTPKGQQSSLIAADYEELLPGEWSAPLLKDVNTPNVTDPLFEGDDLIGPVLRLKLKTNSTTEAKLFAVTVVSTPAKL